MKLKPIIAAMLLVGASSPGWSVMVTTTTTQTQLDAMNARISRVEGLMNQNQAGTGLGAVDTQNWFNSVTISGVLNVDALARNYTPTAAIIGSSRAIDMYGHEDANAFRVADANVLLDAVINCWTTAHIGANFRSLSNLSWKNERRDIFVPVDPKLKHALVASDLGLPVVDEAYITTMNTATTPFYGRFGRQYLTFGDYDVYAPVPSLTQLLSETNQIAAVVGYSDPSSLGANVYAFKGMGHANSVRKVNRTLIRNFGATLAFGDVDVMGYKVGIGYLDNMADTAYVSNKLSNYFNREGYTDRVHALTVNANVKSGQFDGGVKYVAALNDFAAIDVAHNLSGSEGAKPWAFDVNAGYNFSGWMAYPARVGLSYQQSGDAANVGTQGMPERRYQADLNVGVSKNVNVGFTLFDDKDYGVSEGGSSKNALTGVLRLGVDIV